MNEDYEVIDDECNCEDTPIIVYCKKCKRAYLCTKDGERTEISNIKALHDFLQAELHDGGDEYELG